jgi:ribosome-associated protein
MSTDGPVDAAGSGQGDGAGVPETSGATLQVLPGLEVPLSELSFATSRSSGPGGQNVNKVETRVTVHFPVGTSPSLDEHQRGLIQERLAKRISREGMLQVSSQRHRSQTQNRSAALERLAALLREAVAEDPVRRPTRPPAAARRRRLAAKKQRSTVKRLRSQPPDEG